MSTFSKNLFAFSISYVTSSITDNAFNPISSVLFKQLINKSIAQILKSCNSLLYNNLIKSRHALIRVFDPFSKQLLKNTLAYDCFP